MKIPKKISIFGRVYQVNFVPNLMLLGQLVWGIHDQDDHIISIEESLLEEKRLETFIHECGHALLCRIGVRDSGLSLEIEEVIVESYAQMITEMFHLKFREGALGTPNKIKRLKKVPSRKSKAKG